MTETLATLGGIIVAFVVVLLGVWNNWFGIVVLLIAMPVAAIFVVIAVRAMTGMSKRTMWVSIAYTAGFTTFVALALYLIFDSATFTGLVIYLVFLAAIGVDVLLCILIVRYYMKRDSKGIQQNGGIVFAVIATPTAFFAMAVVAYVGFSLLASGWQTGRAYELRGQDDIIDLQVLQEQDNWCPAFLKGLPFGESDLCGS